MSATIPTFRPPVDAAAPPQFAESSATQIYVPTVREGHAFREISQDFSCPAEIFREAIANSLDAYAQRMWLRVRTKPHENREQVVIELCDDGIGMSSESIKAFLNLSDSLKPKSPPPGRIPRRMTGYKGHGTKVYFNSERVEVLTKAAGSPPIYVLMENPRAYLAQGKPPVAQVSEITPADLQAQRRAWGFQELHDGSGTTIRVTGYHENLKKGLEHLLLLDYIRWFTRWGSWEPKLREVSGTISDEVRDFSQCQLFLRGLGKVSPNVDERVPFGHVFPEDDCTDMRVLRQKDDADPLKYFVRTWAFLNQTLSRHPDISLDFLFAIEGEGARREYNDMLRRQRKPRRPGDYLSEERYGLWLCRSFIPIQRFNGWVSEKSEYSRMHAFVNCNALSLTANRGSVENTPQELLEDIEQTVKALFARICAEPDYEKFLDQLDSSERHRFAARENEDFRRRIARLETRQFAVYQGATLLSPGTENDVVALVAALQALLPDLFPFVVRDYDSRFGFDGLATREKSAAVQSATHQFVEFKTEMKPELNHSFDQLDSVVCWVSRVKDGTEIVDLGGRVGTYAVETDLSTGQKRRQVIVKDMSRPIEIFVLRDLLAERGITFRPIAD